MTSELLMRKRITADLAPGESDTIVPNEMRVCTRTHETCVARARKNATTRENVTSVFRGA